MTSAYCIIKNRSYQQFGNFHLNYNMGAVYRTTHDRAVSVVAAL